ncbi:EamA-like transporter family protein [Arthrobacter ulcerisalmonis]|uniref:EamA-like transporter family protein n=1 Tax=Arthrobacter ulcerisalmonis TaxID=2483813 RepID=A0A3P5WDD8_9MICC|nr:DMT family transporter [Arthrobacter ulcerisalmonis]VDC18438.1 EamA-like transporter family protein [Arthrobacter ulcerisalmonis]
MGARWGIFAVVAASVLWGTTGTAATLAPGVSPLAIGAVAMGIGGLLQAAVAARQIRANRAPLVARWRLVAIGALAVAAYPLAFYSAMHLAGVAVGTVVTIGSAPIAAALIEWGSDRRPLSRRWVAGALLGVAGAALLSVFGHGGEAGAPGSTWSSTAGILLGLVAGVTYALYSWAAHRLISAGNPARAAMGAMFGVGGVLLMPVLALTGASLLASASNAAVGLYMALMPMFVGYLLFGWGLSHLRASTATSISLLETVVAAALAVLIVGERLAAPAWVGAAMVVGSLFVLGDGAPKASAAKERDLAAATNDPST